ncbi:hypothetical protein IT571_06910 [Candidatus Sumerlaeota bacterium]|nr:hypothetical protein [Candidatus Sumerlaeota bacterium]
MIAVAENPSVVPAFPRIDAIHTKRVWVAASFVFLFLVCMMTRLYDLGWKAIMHDESLFVYYTYYQLFDKLDYNYLPILHGPTMMELQALVFHIFGTSDYTMRLGVALLGVGGFFWVYALRPWLGTMGTWVALAFYSLSPGITAFQRFLHMDSLYLFNSLWIIASLGHWWRSRSSAWLASACVGSWILFSTKASSLFVFFSIFTFLILLVLGDLCAWVVRGKNFGGIDHNTPPRRFPSALLLALLAWSFIALIITQVFEGIHYDDDVIKEIGHDWILRDVLSIPLALGWDGLSAEQAREAGAAASPMLWRIVYAGMFVGLLTVFSILKTAYERRLGQRDVVRAACERIHAARWGLAGGMALGFFCYLFIFTTFFRNPIGPFEIFAKTWAYWGGQHEWGRIGGPFHQHLLNIAIYETPSLLLVLAVWVAGLFAKRTSRFGALAWFLFIIPVLAFHKLLFSGMEVMPDGGGALEPIGISYAKVIALAAAAIGVLSFALPKASRVLLPLSFLVLIVYSIQTFTGDHWNAIFNDSLYRHGAPVMLKNRHVSFAEFMEIQFNFDGGFSLAIVFVLVFFATILTWRALERGERFHAFLIWWFVTAAGAASYAREAVPQVGIHAMMPCILLAAYYAQRIHARIHLPAQRGAYFALLGLSLLWCAKGSFNLNFRNADDVRERMVYGHTTPQVLADARYIMDYRAIASARVEPKTKTLYWILQNNDPLKAKDLRVGIQSDQVIWPMRWYLRNVEWKEEKNLQKLIDENPHFIFANEDADKTNPQLAEKYLIYRGYAIRFWLPKPLDANRLGNIWKMMIPGHYLDNTAQAGQAYDAMMEWRKVWRYLLLRETFDGGSPGGGTFSGSMYLFCVRKDLY